MPVPFLKKLAKQYKVTIDHVEKLWDKAKIVASSKFKETDKEFYPYVVGITKKMIASEESTTVGGAGLNLVSPVGGVGFKPRCVCAACSHQWDASCEDLGEICPKCASRQVFRALSYKPLTTFKNILGGTSVRTALLG